MNTYKTIIIDDERLAREEVKRALSHYPEFVVLGEAGNADEAITLIEKVHPDLIFLDIHMPEKSGFDLLEELTFVPEDLLLFSQLLLLHGCSKLDNEIE